MAFDEVGVDTPVLGKFTDEQIHIFITPEDANRLRQNIDNQSLLRQILVDNQIKVHVVQPSLGVYGQFPKGAVMLTCWKGDLLDRVLIKLQSMAIKPLGTSETNEVIRTPRFSDPAPPAKYPFESLALTIGNLSDSKAGSLNDNPVVTAYLHERTRIIGEIHYLTDAAYRLKTTPDHILTALNKIETSLLIGGELTIELYNELSEVKRSLHIARSSDRYALQSMSYAPNMDPLRVGAKPVEQSPKPTDSVSGNAVWMLSIDMKVIQAITSVDISAWVDGPCSLPWIVDGDKAIVIISDDGLAEDVYQKLSTAAEKANSDSVIAIKKTKVFIT